MVYPQWSKYYIACMKIQFPITSFSVPLPLPIRLKLLFEHDWKGVKSMDGYVFDRTSDHEKNFKEDAGIIAYCAPYYRMSLMWSKLQREPYGKFDEATVREYRAFLDDWKVRALKL